MGKSKQISSSNRAVIIALYKEGLSTREIAERGYGGKSAVAQIIKRFKTEQTLHVRRRSGRPRITSSREDRILVRKCSINRRSSSKQLACELRQSTGCVVSERTIRRRYSLLGLNHADPQRNLL